MYPCPGQDGWIQLDFKVAGSVQRPEGHGSNREGGGFSASDKVHFGARFTYMNYRQVDGITGSLAPEVLVAGSRDPTGGACAACHNAGVEK